MAEKRLVEELETLRQRVAELGKVEAERKRAEEKLKETLVSRNELAIEMDERNQAEEALRASEENYRELADSISDVFFAMDKDLRYTYWNRASEQLIGVSSKDALGKHLCDIFPDVEATKRAEKVYLEVLRTGQPQTFINEYSIGDKDFWFEISVYATKTGVSVFAKDITEHRRAEQLLQDIFTSTTVGMYILFRMANSK